MHRATTMLRRAAGLALVPLALAAMAGGAQAQKSDSELIATAMTAAPKAIGDGATVIAMGADGSMRTLREGHNGFTCMPTPDPMCLDANAMEWAHAWLSHGTPPDKLGFMYMLAGDTGASNTDPYAKQATADNHWIRTGSHVMVVGPAVKQMAGYPRGADADVSQPYVMWAGTPYEHLMLPAR